METDLLRARFRDILIKTIHSGGRHAVAPLRLPAHTRNWSLFVPPRLQADVTGTILGVVHDASQAVVTGARIVATNTETNLSRETTSAADGSYLSSRFPQARTGSPQLPPAYSYIRRPI
jgi:hypothetical protein